MRKGVLILVLLFAAATAFAVTPEEFDARTDRELQALDASLLPLWHQANAARDAEKHAEAIRLYAQICERQPAFAHAFRRRAGEELANGNRAAAVEHARDAMKIIESSENLAMLAEVLVAGTPTTDEIAEAVKLARRAVQADPNDAYEHDVAAQVGIAANDAEMLRAATERLEVIDPKTPATHLFRMVLARAEGHWSDARAALDRAHHVGLSQSSYEDMRRDLDEATPFYIRWWKPLAVVIGAWFGAFALLLAAGAILSTVAMRAMRETRTDGTIAGLSAGVRRAYAAVLSLCCLFYYASIPIVMLIVLGVAGGLLWAIFTAGHIPVKLVIMIVVVAGVSIWSMAKSLFIRPRDEDPGMRLDLANEPKLRAVLDEVAQRIGTRPIDNVYLTPGTDVAVMERGKGKTKERCLVLGVAALDGFALRPFKSVLGHEYGHFTNRDTAGGAFALAVRNSLSATAYGLAAGGAADWYNPAWLFVNGFNRVFLRISEGASRLQEILADRWAVFAYGADAFERGLRHVVERTVRFDAHVGRTLKEVVDRQVPLPNLYTYTPVEQTDDLTTAIEESLNRKSSPYDSHPTPAERFALIHTLAEQPQQSDRDDEVPVWTLFNDRDDLQHRMTAQVRANVRASYGVEIAAPVEG